MRAGLDAAGGTELELDDGAERHAGFSGITFGTCDVWCGIVAGDEGDTELAELAIVSDELNRVTRDNKRTVWLKHTRRFQKGSWGMREENGRNRVYFGVHRLFASFVENDDHSMNFGRNIGGVPLGLAIAKDVVKASETAGCVSTVKPNPC